jgi:hypothetical protein
MGDVRKARLHTAEGAFEGEALLETAELIFRGERRLVIPFATVSTVEEQDGRLILNGNVVLELGAAAAKWAAKIRNPKTVVQKLGVKARQKVAVMAFENDEFADELRKHGALVSTGKPQKDSDAIFYAAASRADLDRVATLIRSLAPHGALWIVRPKGVKSISESDVMTAGRAAGLVDVKVVRFSETHTAEKFVIPVASR